MTINSRGKGAEPLCKCGCGQPTRTITQTRKSRGQIKGEYFDYLPFHNSGHNSKSVGSTRVQKGYIIEKVESGHWVKQHRLRVETTLGKTLKKHQIVHHHDENKLNNVNNNLVICENAEYHGLLHRRMRALKESGHVNWMKCENCRKWCDPSEFDYIRPNGKSGRHNYCI